MISVEAYAIPGYTLSDGNIKNDGSTAEVLSPKVYTRWQLSLHCIYMQYLLVGCTSMKIGHEHPTLL